MSQAGGVGGVACALVVCQVRPAVSAIVRVAQTGSKKILMERRGADLRAAFSASGWCILAACSRKLERSCVAVPTFQEVVLGHPSR